MDSVSVIAVLTEKYMFKKYTKKKMFCKKEEKY